MPYAHIQNRKNYVVFAWDKYGYYGLVGYFSTDNEHEKIEHFVFSCRVLDMGIENYCAEYIKNTLKIPFDIEIPIRGTSYIEHVDYASAKSMLYKKEEMPFNSKEPKAKIYAGCLSLPIWANCKTNHLLEPAHLWNFNCYPYNNDIKLEPLLIIISLMNEFTNNIPFAEYKILCEQYIKDAHTNNKSLLLISPKNLSVNATDTEVEIYNFWRNVDIDTIHIQLTSPLDHSHFNRYSLSKIASQIDDRILSL